MSITCNEYAFPVQPVLILQLSGEESISRFKALIDRALNTYDTAHPEIKEFGDILNHGAPLQDYWALAGMVKPVR